MYRVGDYVYFESSSSSPYSIRRIEELNKSVSGAVEVKVKCFYRRKDLPETLVALADKHQKALENEGENSDRHILTDKQRHEIKQRELFSSRQMEILPANRIRGKCWVTLLTEAESLLSYLDKGDTFFYCLVLDPSQRTLLADKGTIRVGSKYQVEVPSFKPLDKPDPRMSEQLETLMWTPNHNLTDREIDQFLITSRSVGTFARALDCASSVKQSSLHMNAAAASRDITIFYAMDTIHNNGYELSKAISSLLPNTGPVMCKDEMEEWTASEANLFGEALEKYGKDFNDIRKDFLPWKSMKNIIEYYYMWKTTDKYALQKRMKAVEAELKLKEIHISDQKQHINNNKSLINDTRPCKCCNINSSIQWHAWGSSHNPSKLCDSCWSYWKKYGDLPICLKNFDGDMNNGSSQNFLEDPKETQSRNMSQYSCIIVGCVEKFDFKAQLARHYATVHNVIVRSGSFRPLMKPRNTFYMATTSSEKLSRRLCHHLISAKHAARSPFSYINLGILQEVCETLTSEKTEEEMKDFLQRMQRKDRGNVSNMVSSLTQTKRCLRSVTSSFLLPIGTEKLSRSEIMTFPNPSKRREGCLSFV